MLVVLGPQSIDSYPSSFFSGTINLLLYNSKWGWRRVLLSPVPMAISSGSCSFKSLSTPRFLGLWPKALTWDKEQVSTCGIMLNCCKSRRGRGALLKPDRHQIRDFPFLRCGGLMFCIDAFLLKCQQRIPWYMYVFVTQWSNTKVAHKLICTRKIWDTSFKHVTVYHPGPAPWMVEADITALISA